MTTGRRYEGKQHTEFGVCRHQFDLILHGHMKLHRTLKVGDVNIAGLEGCLEKDQSEGEEGIRDYALVFSTWFKSEF